LKRVRENEVGRVRARRDARVTQVEKFGVIAEFLPGKDGLVHSSELEIKRSAADMSAWSVGDTIAVMLMEARALEGLNWCQGALERGAGFAPGTAEAGRPPRACQRAPAARGRARAWRAWPQARRRACGGACC
jgi:polyribonucleotide nucleotidyltransferase